MSVGFFLIGKDFIKLSPNIIGIGAGLLIGVINYFLFIRNYSCITIIKKFQSQPSKNRQLYAQEFNDNNFWNNCSYFSDAAFDRYNAWDKLLAVIKSDC